VNRISLLAAVLLTLGCASGTPATSSPVPTTRPAPAGTINVVELTIGQVQADYAAHKYTAAQLVQAYLDRIATYEAHYNAFISMNPKALDEARELDREYARSGPRGPLHGVPIVVKDNIDVAGLVTTAGFAGFSKATGGIDMIPAQDAEVVARLRKAGAIILGKTNMPDFAGNGTYSKSTVAGQTFNPYADDREPGGSSGGSATAVNASFAVLGMGTETGGSIQNPSSAQALVGMKATVGLSPMAGIVPIDATFRDVVGPLARTVTDAAIVLDVIAGPSPRDLATYASVGKTPAKGYVAALSTTALAGKRFGLVGIGWRRNFLPLAPETKAIYDRAVAELKARGAEVVEDPFLNTEWKELYAKQPQPSVGAHDMFVYMQGLGATSPFHSVDEWEKLTGKRMPGGGGRGNPVAVTATEQGDAYGAWRKDMRALFRKVMADNKLDGLFFPQAGQPISHRNGDATPNDHPELPSNIINDIGLPTITLPYAYYADGTPCNMAFIGDLWTDDKLLAWAYDFEQATKGRVPPALNTRVPVLTPAKPPAIR
jgi:amidase/aspartyl-tRNA(Asn)/glutamyl-tRNA(Gln) amidotransferase subunit A